MSHIDTSLFSDHGEPVVARSQIVFKWLRYIEGMNQMMPSPTQELIMATRNVSGTASDVALFRWTNKQE